MKKSLVIILLVFTSILFISAMATHGGPHINDIFLAIDNIKAGTFDGAFDVDCNGVVNVNDAIILLRAVIDGTTPSCGDPYSELLSNSKISNALGLLSNQELQYLNARIQDIENNQLNNYDDICYGGSGNLQQLRNIWIKHIAFSLFTEKNNLVPWSILDYSQDEINSILSYDNSYAYFSYACEDITPYQRGLNIILNYLPPSSYSQKDFISSLVNYLRIDGWRHKTGGAFWEWRQQGWDGSRVQGYFSDLDRFKTSGSPGTSAYVMSISRVFNVPYRWLTIAHSNYCFPSEGICYDGDGSVYGQVPASIPGSEYSYNFMTNLLSGLNSGSMTMERTNCEKARIEVTNYLDDITVRNYDRLYYDLCFSKLWNQQTILSQFNNNQYGFQCFQQSDINDFMIQTQLNQVCQNLANSIGLTNRDFFYNTKNCNNGQLTQQHFSNGERIFKLYPQQIVSNLISPIAGKETGIKFIDIDNRHNNGPLVSLQLVHKLILPPPAYYNILWSPLETIGTANLVDSNNVVTQIKVVNSGTDSYNIPFVDLAVENNCFS